MSTTILENPIAQLALATTALQVTQQDIAAADRARQTSCPVATALLRETGKRSFVHSNYVRVYDGSGAVTRYRTSRDLDEMIQAYDRGADFQPGYYTLTKYK